jgi:hypothetical protein
VLIKELVSTARRRNRRRHYQNTAVRPFKNGTYVVARRGVGHDTLEALRGTLCYLVTIRCAAAPGRKQDTESRRDGQRALLQGFSCLIGIGLCASGAGKSQAIARSPRRIEIDEARARSSRCQGGEV